MSWAHLTYIGKSDKYKYVYQMRNVQGKIVWQANVRKKIRARYRGTAKLRPTEREAALCIDKILLSWGLRPVNILKLKKNRTHGT